LIVVKNSFFFSSAFNLKLDFKFWFWFLGSHLSWLLIWASPISLSFLSLWWWDILCITMLHRRIVLRGRHFLVSIRISSLIILLNDNFTCRWFDHSPFWPLRLVRIILFWASFIFSSSFFAYLLTLIVALFCVLIQLGLRLALFRWILHLDISCPMLGAICVSISWRRSNIWWLMLILISARSSICLTRLFLRLWVPAWRWSIVRVSRNLDFKLIVHDFTKSQ
jgi:hypothetical protein